MLRIPGDVGSDLSIFVPRFLPSCMMLCCITDGFAILDSKPTFLGLAYTECHVHING